MDLPANKIADLVTARASPNVSAPDPLAGGHVAGQRTLPIEIADLAMAGRGEGSSRSARTIDRRWTSTEARLRPD
jgi:hypothetical protein